MQVGILHRELRLRLPTDVVLKLRIEIGVEAKLVVEELLVASSGRSGQITFRKSGSPQPGWAQIKSGVKPFYLSCSAARAQPSARMILVSVSINKGWIPLVLPRPR